MNYIIIGILVLIMIILLKNIFGYNNKKIKSIAENKELDEIAKKYPNNIEICKQYLKKLNNEEIEIEENKESETSLYIVATNKILIGNIEKSFTRIQTIAHECLHSIQDKKILFFNFLFSNIYLLYFIIICILGMLRKIHNEMLYIAIFLMLSCIYITIRTYLENDAMIKARYLSEEYLKEKKISSEEEIKKIVNGFDDINKLGIKCVNYYFLMEVFIKLFILVTIFLVR